MNAFRTYLLTGAALVAFAVPAYAQLDSSYFVGAIPKEEVTALGTAPTVTVVAASGAAQTVAFPPYGSSAYDITLTANLTLTVTAPTAAAGVRQSIFLTIRNTAGAWTITWPAGIKWSNLAAAPTFVTTAGTIYVVELVTVDGGTTYQAKL